MRSISGVHLATHDSLWERGSVLVSDMDLKMLSILLHFPEHQIFRSVREDFKGKSGPTCCFSSQTVGFLYKDIQRIQKNITQIKCHLHIYLFPPFQGSRSLEVNTWALFLSHFRPYCNSIKVVFFCMNDLGLLPQLTGEEFVGAVYNFLASTNQRTL